MEGARRPRWYDTVNGPRRKSFQSSYSRATLRLSLYQQPLLYSLVVLITSYALVRFASIDDLTCNLYLKPRNSEISLACPGISSFRLCSRSAENWSLESDF